MHKIKVVSGVFSIGHGSLAALSPEQAGPRRHKLELVDETAGIYHVTSNIEFKGGEVLSVAEVDKGQVHLVEVLESSDGFVQDETPKRGKKR